MRQETSDEDDEMRGGVSEVVVDTGKGVWRKRAAGVALWALLTPPSRPAINFSVTLKRRRRFHIWSLSPTTAIARGSRGRHSGLSIHSTTS